MADDRSADTPVVILVVDAGTPALEDRLGGDDDLVVVIFVVFPANDAAAGCLLVGKAAVCVHAAPPLLQVNRGRRHAENKCPTPGTREPDGAASPVALDAAQSTPQAVVGAKGSCPLSHAAVPAKGTLQPFARPSSSSFIVSSGTRHPQELDDRRSRPFCRSWPRVASTPPPRIKPSAPSCSSLRLSSVGAWSG